MGPTRTKPKHWRLAFLCRFRWKLSFSDSPGLQGSLDKRSFVIQNKSGLMELFPDFLLIVRFLASFSLHRVLWLQRQVQVNQDDISSEEMHLLSLCFQVHWNTEDYFMGNDWLYPPYYKCIALYLGTTTLGEDTHWFVFLPLKEIL